jgi:hypothetical protein
MTEALMAELRALCASSIVVLGGCTFAPAPAPRAAPRAIGGDGVVTFSATTPRGTISVDAEGALSLEEPSGRRVALDRDVVAEVAHSADGATLVYPRRTDGGTALVLRELSSPQPSARVLSEGLSVADRPALSPDRALVAFWGSGGQDSIAGLYVVRADGSAPPRRLNNRGVRVEGPGFVEPPVERSFVFVGERTVRWRGVDGEHTAEVQP